MHGADLCAISRAAGPQPLLMEELNGEDEENTFCRWSLKTFSSVLSSVCCPIRSLPACVNLSPSIGDCDETLPGCGLRSC